jgi:2'-5' RNA ligase
MTDPTPASSARPWRCFWAIPLPDDLRASLADSVTTLRADPTADIDWRWLEPASWHLTLSFLGGVPAAAVPPLIKAVKHAVRDDEPFAVTTAGLGGFPTGRRPRVLWYGVSDPERRLRALARRVQVASGIGELGPFRAHVTLARSRERFGAAMPAPPAGGFPEGCLEVARVTLFRSHLGRGPARYEVLGEAMLAARTAVPAR